MTVCSVRHPKGWWPCTLLLLACSGVWAQAASPSPATTLKQAFTAAWLRQPEAQSQAARQDAAIARRQSANSWMAEPASLELSIKSDRLNSNLGSREDAAALALPLWLPGERARSGALADAEVRAGASRVLAAQLRTAASVRESYWQWQRVRGEHALALERLGSAQQLAADVAKRVKAGDLARSDQHQADGAVATAELGLAEAVSALASASHQLRALIGSPPVAAPDAPAQAEPLPDGSTAAALDARHPALAELADQADVARRAAELARVQTRSNPELTLATARERGLDGDPYQQSVTLGIRIPFGSDSRNRAKVSTAQADQIDAESQLRLAQERLLAEQDSARVRLESAQTQLKAADKRSQLARESRSFFQKSYQMGEADLPTRLRIELEATEAERQAIRTRIDLAAAVSTLRQALGLLPE
jgi:cobalt-zinc-cadmium efflux system outer membrane protein